MSRVAGPTPSGRDWHEGYVVDVSYIEPIAADLCPAWLSMSLVLGGQPPLPVDRPLVWAELGSGSGLSAAMVAAANDHVQVWGCDFNPAHVERARKLARQANLANCSFDEASFEDVAVDSRIGPPELDVVVVHGVYSWVSPASQRQIAEVVRRRLRPGGVAYVMYEVPTGWASMVPVAEALRLHVEADGRRSDLAWPEAVESLHRLAGAGARAFPLGPHEQGEFDKLPNADVRYAVHEYLGSHFGPLMFDQVADAFATARCTYVGSLDPVEHVPDFRVPAGIAELVGELTDPVLVEMVRDLTTERALRRDLFRRGMAPTTVPERERWLDQMTIVRLAKALTDGASVSIPAGDAALDMSFYEPILAALDERPLSVADIRELGGVSAYDALAAACILVTGGYAAPAVAGGPTVGSLEGTERLNRVLAAENRFGASHANLICAATGGAVQADHVEILTLDLLREGHPADVAMLATAVLDILAAQGRQLTEDDRLIVDVTESRRVCEERVVRTIRRQPTYEMLGIA